jgi:hypothetical protein
MEKWPEQKSVDKRTGRELLTKPPHKNFTWKEGYVLRRLTPREAADKNHPHGELATVGDDAFEWVSTEEVDIDE